MNIHEYFMEKAIALANYADSRKESCKWRKVGAVIVRDNVVLSVGHNGTPDGMKSCTDGACLRCTKREIFGEGHGYGICICVHAEENALMSAARLGIRTQGSVLYSTLGPCFICSKIALQAGINSVYYRDRWSYKYPEDEAIENELLDQQSRLYAMFPGGVHQLKELCTDAALPSISSSSLIPQSPLTV